jgi:hypothetical protein
MYNFDNTIVSYPDPRAVERREAYTSRPSYYVSKQTPVYASPLQNTFYTTYGAQRIIEPQPQMARPLTANHYTYASPARKTQTVVDMAQKQTLTQEEPITKVTTTKQVYYPALYKDKQETLEFSEKTPEVVRPTLAALPTYVTSQVPEPVYTNAAYEYDRDYEVNYNQYRSSSAPRGRMQKSRKLDKYHTSHYVAPERRYASPGRTYISPDRNYVAPGRTYVSPERNLVHTVPAQQYMTTVQAPAYNAAYYQAQSVPAAPTYYQTQSVTAAPAYYPAQYPVQYSTQYPAQYQTQNVPAYSPTFYYDVRGSGM